MMKRVTGAVYPPKITEAERREVKGIAAFDVLKEIAVLRDSEASQARSIAGRAVTELTARGEGKHYVMNLKPVYNHESGQWLLAVLNYESGQWLLGVAEENGTTRPASKEEIEGVIAKAVANSLAAAAGGFPASCEEFAQDIRDAAHAHVEDEISPAKAAARYICYDLYAFNPNPQAYSGLLEPERLVEERIQQACDEAVSAAKRKEV